ncbi:hypothetical protein L2E82_06706 [Cichorium intybus]|uniref:Uncharacterized protein n=1 Tax=Cichorium intybus TaxID=13427 RepID=A0ACB9HCA9_CICIN|nr:hypothetical protein L2E82_06706 [Cichorium intybus]
MVTWRIRAKMAEIDVETTYAGRHPTVFPILLHNGGKFTDFPGRRYVNGQQHFINLVDIDTFCVHDIDEIMDNLGYVDEEVTKLYYHFQRPLGDLDFGLFALASDADIRHLATFVAQHKLINVYTEYAETKLHTYSMSPNPSKHDSCVSDFDREDDSNSGDGDSSESDDVEGSESEDSDFVVDEDNLIDDVEVDMRNLHMNIDEDVEWSGGASKPMVSEVTEEEHIEVIDTEVYVSDSASDDGNKAQGRKESRTYGGHMRMPMCWWEEVNEENEEITCVWVLYVSKWKNDREWQVKTYIKEHHCLQTRTVKAVDYKFLSKQILHQVETNPHIPIRALRDQLQRQYKVDISKMKAFRARSAAIDIVKGDYTSQYTILRDYLLEVQKRNPDTTIKLDVECEPNPALETRTFRRVYVCLGALKKGFAARTRDVLCLDGAFMKGPFPGQILTAVGVLPAIAKLFHCAENRYCLRHIHENMKLRWRGKEFKDLLWKCATTCNVQEFRKSMQELKNLNKDTFEWLNKIPAQHWARISFGRNSKLKNARSRLHGSCRNYTGRVGKSFEHVGHAVNYMGRVILTRVV